MFENKIKIKYKKEITKKRFASFLIRFLVQNISSFEKEELISLPLQTLCLAIFDCIILYT